MPINVKKLLPGTEKKLASVYSNKTVGAETVLEAWTYLRRNTLEEIKGRLTKEELTGLIDLFNGTIFEPRFSSHPKFLIAEIEDGEKFQNQGARFGYDYTKLIEKVSGLTSAQVYFLIEEIQRFWDKESKIRGSLKRFTDEFANN